ncbi:response regulator [Phenylobacterium sp.]|uniref:response regulator n=1 Tax=Phenylobacterium sp. TaxID=1871053 RepID=UPI002E2FC049|nr:response regulator [Phenylobacterium sp.]HEX4709256.1 response regulator [Phenylobacterium sp.]
MLEDRILLLAMRGRDAPVIAQLLARSGCVSQVCTSCGELAEELARGAAAALVTEESLMEGDPTELVDALNRQPSWSDFPFILLSTKRSGRRPGKAHRLLEELGNVVVLERPIHSETLDSAVASALRGRSRQYEARRHLEALETADRELRRLNEHLELRISERTEDLRRANDLLMQEIAERERAQAALVQSQKMEAVGQLTGGIAHDFNNLLTVISGSFELIQRRVDDARIAALARNGLQASERAAKLTGQLLAFSRIERLTLRPVDIDGLIASLHDLMPRSLGPAHRIDLQLAGGAVWAMADANQLELAILNLALNARDATPGGGTVRIETFCARPQGLDLPEADHVVIRVSDDGPGIPPHIVDKVFDPFFTTKPVGKGTGLGLSQVYGIARQSGGAARISDRFPGCSVEIWLPKADPLGEDATSATRSMDSHLGAGRHVVVVEDDLAVRRFIVDSLQSLGFAVAEASGGRAALAMLGGVEPDLMVVDYAMPEMNGAELIRAIQALRPGLPILLATGYADMDAVHGVISTDRVLRKPFKIADLATAISHILTPAHTGA